MRMKFNKSSQLVLVSAGGLLVASLLTACSQLTQTLTVDFVFLASSKAAGPNNYGEIDIFEINSESGRQKAGRGDQQQLARFVELHAHLSSAGQNLWRAKSGLESNPGARMVSCPAFGCVLFKTPDRSCLARVWSAGKLPPPQAQLHRVKA